MKNLSKRQVDTLNNLIQFTEQHGYAPSNRELADLMKLNSHSTVHGHLVSLQNKGYIKIVSRRAIRITEKGKLAYGSH